MTDVTLVAYKKDDVNRLHDYNGDGIREVIPLTPSATCAARQVGLAVADPLVLHDNAAHQRDVTRRQQLEQFLETRLQSTRRLSKTGKQVLIDYAVDVCGVASHLWGLLEHATRYLHLVDDAWQVTTDRRHVHRSFLDRILGAWNNADIITNYGNTPWKLRWQLHRRNMKFLRAVAKTRPIVLNAFSRGFKSFTEQISQFDGEPYLLEFCALNGSDELLSYIQTWLNWARTNTSPSPRTVTLIVPPRRAPRQAHFAAKILDAIPDDIARAGVDVLKPTILTNVEWVETVLPVYRKYLKTARARAVITYDAADRLNAALNEAAQAVRIPSLLFCHTSVSPGFDPISQEAKRRRTIELGCSDLADVIYTQSPHADEAVKQYAPDVPRRAILPFVWGGGVKDEAGEPNDVEPERIILHAGYYLRWPQYLPWVYETSHEHIAALRTLVEATSRCANTKLIIRPKGYATRGEFDEESLRASLPDLGCFEIREDGSFYDYLQRADLVVSFHSATIEEALMARRPVLLLGGKQRYLHVPARQTSPTRQDRAAVYAPKADEDLATLLQAVLEAHAGVPLRDDELAGHLWSKQHTPGMADVARELLAM